MHSFTSAEWGTWGLWSSCSATCNHGVRQKVRSCSVVDGCRGMGLDTATEYCSPGNCAVTSALGEKVKVSKLLEKIYSFFWFYTVTRTKGYKVTKEAKEAFLASGITTSSTLSNVSPKFHCLHECLRMRVTMNSISTCNSFLLEGGTCKMSYMSPDWVVDQVQNPGEEAIIYFDLIVSWERRPILQCCFFETFQNNN